MIAATTTHATLLARLADGENATAWSEFCDRYGDLIRGFARRRGLQPADCDDVHQDVLLRLSKTLPGFRYDTQRGKFRSYLKTIVLHAIFDRSSQNRDLSAVDLVGVDSLAANAADARDEELWEQEWRRYHVRCAMRVIAVEFSQRDAQAFQRYALDGADARQVAEELAMSIDQVYQAKSLILRRLTALIADQVAEEG